MIKVENIETYGWLAAIRGMRNPKNSWENSDSTVDDRGNPWVGKNDLKLMKTLANAGSDHGKFLRMITITMDITAPFYIWKEFDTYKVGTVANSCSTMHKITSEPITKDSFCFDFTEDEDMLKSREFIIGKCEEYRQKFLETAFTWHADLEGLTGKDAVVDYMQKHRNDKKADELWKYFENVFTWVEDIFGKYDRNMKGVKWGLLYNEHKDDNLDSQDIQKRIPELLADKEVQKKSGIYEYLLTGEEKVLSLRAFDQDEKITMYNRQEGKCAICGKPFDINDMQADHVVPWSKGGKTTLDNGQMLCVECNLKKSNH